jgi:hypothetical protein
MVSTFRTTGTITALTKSAYAHHMAESGCNKPGRFRLMESMGESELTSAALPKLAQLSLYDENSVVGVYVSPKEFSHLQELQLRTPVSPTSACPRACSLDRLRIHASRQASPGRYTKNKIIG